MKDKIPLADQIAKDKKLFEIEDTTERPVTGEDQDQQKRLEIDLGQIKTKEQAKQALSLVIDAGISNKDPKEEERLFNLYSALLDLRMML